MNLQPLKDYVARHIDVTPEEEEIYLSKFKYRRYLKHQFVGQMGDVAKCTNFVLSGCLKQFYVDVNGQEHIVMFAVENWWTSDLGSFINQQPADYNVQCLENTELAQISYNDLKQLYIEVPKFERLFRIIFERAVVASGKRIINNISLSAKERYLNFRKQYPLVDQRVPQYMIASYLGITKEFLSKIRNQLIHE